MRKVVGFQCLSCQLTLTLGTGKFFPFAGQFLNFPRASRMQAGECSNVIGYVHEASLVLLL